MKSIDAFDAAGPFQNQGNLQVGSIIDVPVPIPSTNPFIRARETGHFPVGHREPNGASHSSNGATVLYHPVH